LSSFVVFVSISSLRRFASCRLIHLAPPLG
jgi:hypothetical protein